MQNFLWPSEDLTSARYVKQAGTVITPDAALAPDNTMTADLVDMSAAGAGTGWYQISAIVGNLGTTITRQVWLKGLVGGEVVTLQDSAYSLGTKTVTLTNDWLPYTLSSTTGATLASGLWVVKVSGNGYYAWGMSMANANWAGDYAKTTTGIINTGRPRDLVLKQNLLPYSHDFTNAFYAKSNGDFVGQVFTDEYGSGSVNHLFMSGTAITTNVVGKVVTLSTRVKAGTKHWINFFGAAGTQKTYFDILNGVKGTESGVLYSSITPSTDGYFICSITFVCTSLLNFGMKMVNSDNDAGYIGDGTGYITVDYMQLVAANWSGDYAPTNGTALTNPIRNIVLKQNLLTYSEDMSKFTAASLSLGTKVINPLDGAVTADVLVPFVGNAQHYSYLTVPPTQYITGGSTVTFSALVKSYGWNWLRLQVAAAGVNVMAYFDIVNGTVGTLIAGGQTILGATIKPFISPYDTGWFEITFTVKAEPTKVFGEVYYLITDTDNTNFFVGDGVKGVAIFASQLTNVNWRGDYQMTNGVRALNPIRNIVLKQNLITNSTDLSTWTKSGVTIDAVETADGYTCNKFSGVGDATFCYTLTYPSMFGVGAKLSTSFLFKRISTSGVVRFYQPLSAGFGEVTIDMAQMPDSFVLIDTNNPIVGVTVVYPWTMSSTWSTGVRIAGATGTSGLSFYVAQPQIVAANWRGDYQPTSGTIITNPIRNIVKKQNLLQTSDLTSVLVTKVGTPTIVPYRPAPDNTNTAFDVSSANTTTYVQQAVGVALKIGATYTTSIWLKADADCDVGIEFIDIGDGNPAYAVTAAVKTHWKQFSVPPTVLGATASGGAMGIIVGSRFALWPTARTITMWHPQIVQANWVGDDCPLSGVPINNPIRNIVL